MKKNERLTNLFNLDIYEWNYKGEEKRWIAPEQIFTDSESEIVLAKEKDQYYLFGTSPNQRSWNGYRISNEKAETLQQIEEFKKIRNIYLENIL